MRIKIFFAAIALALAAAGCTGALQRGMLEQSYVSTARPAISVTASNMPLLTYGQGMPNLAFTGEMGGLPIQMWVAVYGTGGLAPLAVSAQAQVPQGWYWDSGLTPPFGVDAGTEVFNGKNYDACTRIVNPANSPFGALVTGVHPDGSPQLWVARYYSARYNFDADKMIMQYMEPLPEGITSLESMPMGQGDFLQQFARRAREAFSVGEAPKNPQGVRGGYSDGIRWQFMTQTFLGTVSKYDYMNSFSF